MAEEKITFGGEAGQKTSPTEVKDTEALLESSTEADADLIKPILLVVIKLAALLMLCVAAVFLLFASLGSSLRKSRGAASAGHSYTRSVQHPASSIPFDGNLNVCDNVYLNGISKEKIHALEFLSRNWYDHLIEKVREIFRRYG